MIAVFFENLSFVVKEKKWNFKDQVSHCSSLSTGTLFPFQTHFMNLLWNKFTTTTSPGSKVNWLATGVYYNIVIMNILSRKSAADGLHLGFLLFSSIIVIHYLAMQPVSFFFQKLDFQSSKKFRLLRHSSRKKPYELDGLNI